MTTVSIADAVLADAVLAAETTSPVAVAVALAAGLGTYLLYSAVVFGWRGIGGPRTARSAPLPRAVRKPADWLAQAGLGDVQLSEFLAVEAAVLMAGTALGWLFFAAPVPAVLLGLACSGCPVAVYRSRRRKLLDQARESWPRLLEEIRLLTGSVGRSIPLSLLEVGRRTPTAPMRAAFEAAEREWQLSTDFRRTIAVLKARLADATADACCETLLVAHEIGGTDLEHRLVALIDDRIADVADRKDALSRQAGARFGRWFVLGVPVGMALVGLSIGDGRRSYRQSYGQVAVALAIITVGACWLWASRIMRLPESERVFVE